MFEPLLEDEDEVMKYTAVAVYKVSLIETLYFLFEQLYDFTLISWSIKDINWLINLCQRFKLLLQMGYLIKKDLICLFVLFICP